MLPETILIDLRHPLAIQKEPLSLYFPHHIIVALRLEQLEMGSHNLDKNTPLLVVCEMGSRSKVAVLYLQAEGYQAQNLAGGTRELKKPEFG